MCQEKLSMRRLREVLRLKLDCDLSNRKIGRAVGISPSTVSYYVRAFQDSQLTWPLADSFDDDQLVQALQPHCRQLQAPLHQKVTPDYADIYMALKQKILTKQTLWQEYKDKHGAQAYSYSEFCRRYKRWLKTQNPSLRQRYVAGEKCFVDYAGPTVPIINAQTGEIRKAYIFIGVLGASNYTYAEATLSRQIPDWLGSHTRMLNFFGGVPTLVIPDNEKAGVNKACYYDPELNPNYAAWAAHYSTTVLPTRPAKPQDKAKVETAVQIVERWILARIRDLQFFSLPELNAAISELLNELNEKPFQKLPGSRSSQFQSIEQEKLKPLPAYPYEFTRIKRVKVKLDYHIEVEGHHYSVPYKYMSETVEYHLKNGIINVFFKGKRIASHIKHTTQGEYTTCDEHMPHAHRKYQSWSPQAFISWANKLGPSANQVAIHIINTQPHPECCQRIHHGLVRLAKFVSTERFEKACCYAIKHKIICYKSIKSILDNHLEAQFNEGQSDEDFTSTQHSNLRGNIYYLETN